MTELTEIDQKKTRKLILNNKALILLLKIVITAGVLLYIIYNVNFRILISTLTRANYLLIGAAFLLIVFNIYLQYKKWMLVCEQLLQSCDKKKIIRSLFYGIAAGSFTPIRVGEFFGRAIEFKDQSLVQVTFATLVDKFFLLFVVAFFGSLSALLFLRIYFLMPLMTILLLLLLDLTIFGFIVFIAFKPEVLRGRISDRLLSIKAVSSLKNSLSGFKNLDKKFTVKMIVISTIFFTVYVTQYALLVLAFSANSNFILYFWAGVLVMFTKSVIAQFTFIDFGVREGASVFILTKMGELSSVAFNAPVVLFFINVIIPSVIGVILFYKKDND